MSIQPKAQMADPRKLRPNPWNTNVVDAANEAKLEESLKKFGMFKPVIVRELPTGDLEILGGEHRAGAAVRLGIKDIPIMNLGPLGDAEAKKIGLVDNGRYGNDDTLQLAALLKELGDIEDLASFMPFSDQDFSNIIDSAEIDLDDLEALPELDPASKPAPLPTAPQTHTIMRFKVPIEDAERLGELINHVIKVQGLTGSDSLTNAGDALVHLLTGIEGE